MQIISNFESQAISFKHDKVNFVDLTISLALDKFTAFSI